MQFFCIQTLALWSHNWIETENCTYNSKTRCWSHLHSPPSLTTFVSSWNSNVYFFSIIYQQSFTGFTCALIWKIIWWSSSQWKMRYSTTCLLCTTMNIKNQKREKKIIIISVIEKKNTVETCSGWMRKITRYSKIDLCKHWNNNRKTRYMREDQEKNSRNVFLAFVDYVRRCTWSWSIGIMSMWMSFILVYVV